MKRLLYMATLLMVASLIFAPAALAQSRGPSGADGTFNCQDFDFQEDAQAFFEQDTSDPDGLDGPVGTSSTGIPNVACEELPSRGTATPPAEEKMEMKTEEKKEMKTEEKKEEKGKEKEKMKEEKKKEEKKEEKKEMPKTGGPAFGSLLGLGAGVLLVGGGLIALKRRNS